MRLLQGNFILTAVTRQNGRKNWRLFWYEICVLLKPAKHKHEANKQQLSSLAVACMRESAAPQIGPSDCGICGKKDKKEIKTKHNTFVLLCSLDLWEFAFFV